MDDGELALPKDSARGEESVCDVSKYHHSRATVCMCMWREQQALLVFSTAAHATPFQFLVLRSDPPPSPLSL